MSDPRPLDGVVVLDLTRLLPGAWCSMVLADFGADVLKVEQSGTGDYSRWAPPRYREESVYFQGVNRNKRSLTLDLGQAAVSLLERKFWENLCRYAGRPDLIDPAETADQRITDHGSRGEHTEEVLRGLSYTEADIARLRRDGVV